SYHLRGSGDSSRTPPYDLATDADDLVALVEAAGGGAVVIASADAGNRAVRAAAARPDLFNAVVAANGNLLGADVFRGTREALAASPSVLEALVVLMRSNFRAGLHTVMGNTNPALDDSGVHDRVELAAQFTDAEAAVARLEAWIADDASAAALSL